MLGVPLHPAGLVQGPLTILSLFPEQQALSSWPITGCTLTCTLEMSTVCYKAGKLFLQVRKSSIINNMLVSKEGCSPGTRQLLRNYDRSKAAEKTQLLSVTRHLGWEMVTHQEYQGEAARSQESPCFSNSHVPTSAPPHDKWTSYERCQTQGKLSSG